MKPLMPIFPDDPPAERFQRALALQELLIDRATGPAGDPAAYQMLRRDFTADPATKPLLPRYVRSCRDLDAFWPLAKAMSPHWEGRRVQIRQDFEPLLDHLEEAAVAPLDGSTAAVLTRFSADGVASVWHKALDRRATDPAGAITAARTLLETVCKHILDNADETYDDGADLPRLYRQVAKLLNLSPSAHTKEVFRQILGGCASVVEGLGAVRNKISDAHGHGAKAATPSARHAALAVNLSGAMATFLVETWQFREGDA